MEFYTDTVLIKLNKLYWKPDWLSIGVSPILPVMVNKFSTSPANNENILLLNFSKKNLNHFNIKGNKTCIAVVENIDDKRKTEHIWNKNNELFDEVFTVDELTDWLEENNMKFDKIIMNPPYSKNLHLKVLEKAIENLSEDGECVNLSPIRWLQDPLAKNKLRSDFNKFEESVSKHITDIKMIIAKDAQQFFDGTVMGTDLGIYHLIKNIGDFNYKYFAISPILAKRISFFINNHPIIEKNKKDGWRVRVPSIIGGKSGGSGNRKSGLRTFGKLLYFYNGLKENKPWYEWYMKNQYSKTTPEITASIKFSSELAAKNFLNQFTSNFVKYVTHELICDVNVCEEQILWMENCINPRTGLKGYESEWTDEDFYQYFNITDEERKIIETTMEKYK